MDGWMDGWMDGFTEREEMSAIATGNVVGQSYLGSSHC